MITLTRRNNFQRHVQLFKKTEHVILICPPTMCMMLNIVDDKVQNLNRLVSDLIVIADLRKDL